MAVERIFEFVNSSSREDVSCGSGYSGMLNRRSYKDAHVMFYKLADPHLGCKWGRDTWKRFKC
eukprot:6179887-Pleurochrysis_carterae.AAC.1